MASVMVVEDEDVLLEMIAALIEEVGHRALVATNGHEALSLLQAEPDLPALIISDIMMPQMNGVALAQALKADPRFESVPIVLMSAAGHSPQATIADLFVHKPFELDHMESIIEQYVGTTNGV